MSCNHDGEVLPLYARNQKSGAKAWTSSELICGSMIHVCVDCGAVLEKSFIKKKTLTTKKEVNKNG